MLLTRRGLLASMAQARGAADGSRAGRSRSSAGGMTGSPSSKEGQRPFLDVCLRPRSSP
jgi:hypothetical protein